MSLWLIQLALNAHPGLCPGDIQIKETTCEERNSNQLEGGGSVRSAFIPVPLLKGP